MSKRAFTLMELLVVVTIIALLIAILVPSLRGSRDKTNQVICASNLRGQGQSFAMFAEQNNDLLPSTPGGYWLHDQSNANCQALVGVSDPSNTLNNATTMIRKWFYCPSNAEIDISQAWMGIDPATGRPSVDANGNGYRFLDYAYFNQRGLNISLPIQRVSGKQPPIQWYARMSQVRGMAEAQLACDELISSTTGGSDFYVPNRASNFHEHASHLGGKKPEGMNALYLDGHVAWLPFDIRNSTPVPQGGNAYFWVVDP